MGPRRGQAVRFHRDSKTVWLVEHFTDCYTAVVVTILLIAYLAGGAMVATFTGLAAVLATLMVALLR